MSAPIYTLYYHVGLPGRGEYVRLVLEAAGVAYEDVAKRGGEAKAVQGAVMAALAESPHFAPPFLTVTQDGAEPLTMSQTAVCSGYVADRHGLTPARPAHAVAAKQLVLTMMDLASETHNTHQYVVCPWSRVFFLFALRFCQPEVLNSPFPSPR